MTSRDLAVEYIAHIINIRNLIPKDNFYGSLDRLFREKGIIINQQFSDNILSLLMDYDAISNVYKGNQSTLSQFISATKTNVLMRQRQKFEGYPVIFISFYDKFSRLVDFLLQGPETKCEGEYIDIRNLDSKSFANNLTKIMSLKDYISDFPLVIESVNEIYENIRHIRIFRFKFENICGHMLFIIKKAPTEESTLYEFIWIISNASFKATEIQCLSVIIIDDGQKLQSNLNGIATKDCDLPELKMNGRNYTRIAVPMILGLNLIYYLGFNETELTDAASKQVKCGLNEYRFSILDERIMTCGTSIYGKYGFVPDSPNPQDLLCKLKLQDIIDDYKIRIDNMHIIRNSIRMRYPSLPEEDKKLIDIAAENIIKVIGELEEVKDKNITIKEWLEQFSGTERNCKVVILRSLNNRFFIENLKIGNITYGRPRFAQLYRKITTQFANKDIKKTIDDIYTYGLPTK